MLKNDDLYSEIENLDGVIETLKSPYEKAMLKSQSLILKLLHNVRTNQTLSMKAQGVELRKSKTSNDEATVTK